GLEPLKVGQRVVVKLPRLDLRFSPAELRDRLNLLDRTLTTEADALGKLRGVPRIPLLYDLHSFLFPFVHPVKKTDELVKVPFIVQEFVEGVALDKFVTEAPEYRHADGTFHGIPKAQDWYGMARELVEQFV